MLVSVGRNNVSGADENRRTVNVSRDRPYSVRSVDLAGSRSNADFFRLVILQSEEVP